MHTFTHDEINAGLATRMHAARTAELAAEAAARQLSRKAARATHTPLAPALRNRIGKALVSAGTRLMQPTRTHARIAG